MKRFLFYMGHPAHYHNFKNVISILNEQGNKVLVIARGKDVLFDEQDWDIVKWPARESKGKMGLVLNVLNRELELLRIVRKFKPNLMVGTDIGIAHVGRLTGVPSIIVNEDDSHAIPLMAKFAFPYATKILAPNCCDQSPSNHKKIGYEGYHELAYLHPEFFTPNRSLLPAELKKAKRYFILRFASLHAHHDKGRRGIDDSLAEKLINLLEKCGDVFITSERELGSALEQYRLPIDAKIIHHAMAFADLYIGDSQTMAAEAAVLGIPSIRFNDFVGELNYLEELESKYGLTKGIRADRADLLFQTVNEMLDNPDLKKDYQKKREHLFSSTVNVTRHWVDVFKDCA